MTKMEYAQKVAEIIGGVANEYKKNNGVVYTGVSIDVENGIAPVMYIDEFFDNGMEVEKVAEIIKSKFEEYKGVSIDMNMLDDFEHAKDKIHIELINKKNIDDRIVYKSAEEYGFDDLILVPVMRVDLSGQVGRVKINNNLVKNWGVTADEVIEIGIENIDCIIEPLAKKLARMTGMPEEEFGDGEIPFVIVSTESGEFGASAIIKAKEQLNEMFPDGYVVLPSSIHEMLVVPNTNEDDRLESMVSDVNCNVISDIEYLSDRIYKFVA